jgi:hypothetical protein
LSIQIYDCYSKVETKKQLDDEVDNKNGDKRDQVDVSKKAGLNQKIQSTLFDKEKLVSKRKAVEEYISLLSQYIDRRLSSKVMI